MKLVAVVLAVGLWATAARGQTTIAGQDVPDAISALFYLDAYAETGTQAHSDRFKAFISNVNGDPAFPTGSGALIQLVLEQYYVSARMLHASFRAEADGYADANDTTDLYKLQASYAAQRVTLANNTIAQLSSQMKDGGMALAERLANFKDHITLSSTDPVVAYVHKREGIIDAIPAAMHSHPGMPQGSPMNFSYSSWYTDDVIISGYNADGSPYGTDYFDIGMQGTTTDCSGVCLTATHTGQSNFNHVASGKGNQAENYCAGPPYDVMQGSCGYTYSWPFNGDGPYHAVNANDTALVNVLCTIRGIPVSINPIPVLDNNNPPNSAASEMAWTFAQTGQGNVSCTLPSNQSCNLGVTNPGQWCSAATTPPDYRPLSAAAMWPGQSVLSGFLVSEKCYWETQGVWWCDPSTHHSVGAGNWAGAVAWPSNVSNAACVHHPNGPPGQT